MYRLSTTLAAALVIALGAAGCSEGSTSPTATDDLVNLDLVAFDDYGFTRGSGPGQGCATGPGTCFGTGAGANRSYLGTLVQQAYQQLVTEQGQEAADAAFAALWKLHQDAFALRSSDHTAFVTAMQAAHQESVRLVVAILGTGSAATVIELAADKLDALLALIAEQDAAGANVARLQYVAERAAAYLADAESRLAAGDAAGALDLASRALQAATMGGGQNARRTGPGAGGGQQFRGGR